VSPNEYLARYRDLAGWLSETEVFAVGILKYLVNDGNTRAKGAAVARGRILKKLDDEYGMREQYTVDGYAFSREHVKRVSWGKASPNQILDTYWLAYRYGLVTADGDPKPKVPSPQQYADWYTGLDCNGFVDNYFGFTRQHSIPEYDRKKARRDAPDAILERDVVITHDIDREHEYCHIRLVAGSPTAKGSTVSFDTAESYGWNGIGIRKGRTTLALRKGTNVFVDKPEIPGREYYIVPPPPEAGDPTP
jgi:hypothetical protein